MAKLYFEQLKSLMEKFPLDEEEIEVKHFFSGAAIYSRGEIITSLSPMGLAFKLSEKEVDKLIRSGKAVPLKYFEKGNIKNGYAMFQEPNLNQVKRWKSYFFKSIEYNNENST